MQFRSVQDRVLSVPPIIAAKQARSGEAMTERRTIPPQGRTENRPQHFRRLCEGDNEAGFHCPRVPLLLTSRRDLFLFAPRGCQRAGVNRTGVVTMATTPEAENREFCAGLWKIVVTRSHILRSVCERRKEGCSTEEEPCSVCLYVLYIL